MSTNFNDTSSNAVNEAIAARNNNGNSEGSSNVLNTAQGGDSVSPVGAAGVPQGSHGTLVAGYAVERSIQGDQSLEVLTADQKEVRVGNGVFGSSNIGVAQVNTTNLGNVGISMPTNQNISVSEVIPNVANRFSR
jgi:hypothetical protein